MNVRRCIETTLTIADNEAQTALATLRRLGVPVGTLQRADLYCFEVECGREADLLATVRNLETIFNPNKHRLDLRKSDVPAAGEVWIAERNPTGGSMDTGGGVVIAGKRLPGVRHFERKVAWALRDEHGTPASYELVERATSALLCNPAFQEAEFGR